MAMFTLGLESGALWKTGPTSSKLPEPVSAGSRLADQIIATTMGSPIPYVVGTGQVEGLYFIGGMVTETIVTYTEVTERQPDVFDRVSFSSPNYVSEGSGGKKSTYDAPGISIDMRSYVTKMVPNNTYKTTAHVGYILAYDAYELGYDLIRLEVDGRAVFDSESGIGASLQFRFYGGRQTRVDPLLTDIIGPTAGAYQNFVMLFLEGYDSTSPPSVRAVISNAATGQPPDRVLEWTGAIPSHNLATDSSGVAAAYDPVDNVLYHLLSQDELDGVSQVWLVAFNLDTRREMYRVPLEDSSLYAGLTQQVMAIRGSGHVLVRLGAPGATPDVNRIYNATTGKKFGNEYVEGPRSPRWKMGMAFNDKYVVLGHDVSSPMFDTCCHAVIDLATGSLDVTFDTTLEAGDISRGRTYGNSVSFFVTDLGGAPEPAFVMETVFDGVSWTNRRAYDAIAGNEITGCHYDAQTGFLVVTEYEEATVTSHIRCINPDTGIGAETLSTEDTIFFILTATQGTGAGRERYWPRPGFVLMQKGGVDDPGSVWMFSIAEQALSLYAENPSVTNEEFHTGIFDQTKLVWYSIVEDDHWIEHALPNQAPSLVPLADICTAVMFLAGFSPGELTYEGFDGLSSYGFVIAGDTTVQAQMRSIADVWDFSFCDTGSGFVFKKPGRDGAASTDAMLTAEDLVEQAGGAVRSRDEANLRMPVRIEFEYVSKDARYQVRPASFSMPTGVVLPSIRTERFSTPFVMTDLTAQQLVTERFFEAQQDRRAHNFMTVAEHMVLLPGDIVSVPSGDVSYIAKIDDIAIELRNMSVDINCSDFQTEVSAEISAVSNNPGLETLFSWATQYIHLDIPLYDYSDDLGGSALVQYGMLASRGPENWAGGVLYSGIAPTSLAGQFDQAPHGGVVGSCVDVLAAPPGLHAGDFVNSVTIRVTSGDPDNLVDKTEAEVMQGANICAIGQEGRWEVLGFTSVEDNGDGSFTLSGFAHRGYRGTEVYADDHAVGDLFVLLNLEWLRSVAHPLTDLDDTFYYKAAGIGQDPAGLPTLPHTVAGAAETPYAPVNLAAEITGSDILLEWDYRSRLEAWEMFDVAPDSGEATLAFEIDIMDGATVKRTLTATTNSKTYLAADIASDFGSMPATLSFRVYQMSAAVGRGHQAEATVTL